MQVFYGVDGQGVEGMGYGKGRGRGGGKKGEGRGGGCVMVGGGMGKGGGGKGMSGGGEIGVVGIVGFGVGFWWVFGCGVGGGLNGNKSKGWGGLWTKDQVWERLDRGRSEDVGM